MIKIFRDIRKNLLNEGLPAGQAGKTTKYFTYAIGKVLFAVRGLVNITEFKIRNEFLPSWEGITF